MNLIGCSLNASPATIRINLSYSPHPQPLSQAWERGVRGGSALRSASKQSQNSLALVFILS